MILIVDDKPAYILFLQQLLESHGFSVDTAQSKQEALKKAIRNRYALIILDLEMLDMDGVELFEKLHDCSITKDIPIIFLLAQNQDRLLIEQESVSGGIDYVLKPVDTEILMLKVKIFHRIHKQTLALKAVQENLLAEIDGRKSAQLALQEKANHLRLILESLPLIAFTVNQDGKIDFVNKNWFKFAATEQDYPACPPGDPSVEEILKTHILEGRGVEMEIRILPLGSELYRYHLLRIVPIEEHHLITHWVGTFTDIDDQKHIEQKKDEFLSIASHELKTPLTSMRGYVQLLDRSLPSVQNTTTHKYMNRVQDQLDKLSSLVADLLDISKMDNGKLKIHYHRFDLDALIDSVIETMHQTHENRALHIERMGNRLDSLVLGDEVRIEQVLINLMNNAIKYSPDSDRIIVHTESNKQEVKVSIQDFGIGVPIKNQAPIFDKFYRVEETSVRFQGLGLGLYISAEIIRQHKGTYGMESQLGVGSTFYFTLPLIENS